MIPRDFVTEWRAVAPWVLDRQVEQDLVIARALVELFSRPRIATALAFRGGTALYKLHLRPAARYSEDIELVQTQPGAIGSVLDAIHEALDPWLGRPRWKQSDGRVALHYRFASEDEPPLSLRLKVEINSQEHFSVLGFHDRPFEVASRWFRGAAAIRTYELDELLGTKLRALYQRKKGRDLFDLALALRRGAVDPARIVAVFDAHMDVARSKVTRAMFEQNLARKRSDPAFAADITPLLAPGQRFDFGASFDLVWRELVARLRGDPWQGA